MTPWLLAWLSHYGGVAVFVLLVLGILGLPVPDETVLTLAGVLIGRDQLRLGPTLLAAVLGSVCGISLSYALGRSIGAALLTRYGQRLHISAALVARTEMWFEHRGHWALTFGYFLPGIRHLTALLAGSSGLPYATFWRYAYGGALLWATTFVLAGYSLGENWEPVLDAVRRHVALLSLLIGLVVAAGWLFRRARM